MTEYLHSFDNVSNFYTKYENETGNKISLKISTPEGAEYTATTNNLVFAGKMGDGEYTYFVWKDEVTGDIYNTGKFFPSVGDEIYSTKDDCYFDISEVNTEPLEENDYYHEPWVSLTDIKNPVIVVNNEEYEYVKDVDGIYR